MTAPLSPRGRRPLGAHVTGYGAVWAYNLLSDRAADSIRHHAGTGRSDIAQQIADAVAELREAARQHQAAMEEIATSSPGSGEAEASSFRAPSEPLGPPSGFPSEVDVRAAAAALEVGERRVRQLLRAGDLTGRQDRTGRWSVDADDLDRLVADRRITA